ncbi:5'-nucleotidase C-terminal domain-containing protein [Clostridium thermarum]|uniref:5'-nucleotidase C-terminal domain-containing protein n=1 Tax=Clostridium thermarum TaxID=1716543 RepID=UPI0013D588DE|nr:5'-nucleotidase C-terminal domain-containing protein [Clostridium thermarum]
MKKTLKTKLSLMVVFLFIFTFITPISKHVSAAEKLTLQILATSDMHNKFVSYDYALNKEGAGSLAELAVKIKDLRAQNPNTILVDNGDTLQGTSSILFVNDELHPMIAAMNELKYDSMNLGNHEFNYGMDFTNRIDDQAKFPILCGNVFDGSGKAIHERYTIVERGGIKIGIIGVVSPHITKWDAANLQGYTVTDPSKEAAKIAKEIEDQVDTVVLTIHAGETPEYGNGDSVVDAIREIKATGVTKLAAVIGGHSHAKAAKLIDGIPVVLTGSLGANLGQINIPFVKKDGKFILDTTTEITYANIPTTPMKQDQTIVELTKTYHDRALADAVMIIGKLEGWPLAPADEIKGIPQAQLQDTALMDIINTVQLYYGKPEDAENIPHVSAAALFNANANIQPGDIKKSDTSLVYKYDNTLVTLKINGAQLKKYMEWSVSYYNTFKAGDLTVSFDPDIRLYNYDMFANVKYDVNISKEKGNRIENLTYMDGTPVLDTDVLYLTVNNYRGNTTLLNDQNGLFKEDAFKTEVVFDSTMTPIESQGVKYDQVRDLIGVYIRDVKGGTITPETDNNWKLTGYSYDLNKRAAAVRLINEGKLPLPASEDGRTPNARSITWEDVLKVPDTKIDIVSFNDFHGTLLEGSKDPGASKLVAEIKKLKTSNPNTFVVSGGDLYQGSAMSNLLKGEPVTKMLLEIGVLASAIGNHEYDWGPALIPQWAAAGNFDFLASNIYMKGTETPYANAKPYMLKEVEGKKIGFIGLATPETAFKTSPENVADLEFRDPIISARYWAKYLKDNKLADVVIALTHLGAFQNAETNIITGEAADLANNVEEIDAIICSHTHQKIIGHVNGKPVVQGYYNGRVLAKLSLGINVEGNLTSITPSLDDLSAKKADIKEDPAMKAIIERYSADLEPLFSQLVAVTEIDLPHDRYEGLTVLGAYITEVMAKVTGTQIAITNGGGIREPIAKGNITLETMYKIMPFDNTLVTMKLKGSDLKRVIEHGIMPEGFGWGQFYGIKVYYDATAPAGQRITSMRLLDGTQIDMDEYYTVVTNDFVYANGDKYDFSGAIEVFDTGKPIRDEVMSALMTMTSAELRALEANALKVNEILINGPDTTPVVDTPETLPQTGSMVDDNVLYVLSIFFILSGAAIIASDRKNKNKMAA